MGIAQTMRISTSALTAERLRMDVIANNLANAHTTGPEGPYRRRMVVFRAIEEPASFSNLLVQQSAALQPNQKVVGAGVKVVRIAEDPSPGQKVYEPDHPDADQDGFVTYPNVNMVSEMIDLLAATRAYKANVAVINATKAMAMKSLTIGK